MGAWAKDSRTHVAQMSGGDFFANEKSATITEHTAGKGRIEFVGADGGATVLKDNLKLDKGDVVDATKMSAGTLRQFFKEQIEDAKQSGILLSLHMKATMMKVSGPYYFSVIACPSILKTSLKNMERFFAELGINPNNGLGDVYAKIGTLPATQQEAIKADLQAAMQHGPGSRHGGTPTGVSPTCTCRVTSSSMLRWRRRFASAGKCGGRTARNTT